MYTHLHLIDISLTCHFFTIFAEYHNRNRVKMHVEHFVLNFTFGKKIRMASINQDTQKSMSIGSI